MPVRDRPLSPHLFIYRWQIGNTLSILHRLTGMALAAGLVALSYWLIALAGGPATYVSAMRVLAGPIGLIVMIGWTLAFTYHLLNGVRHLFWDAGYGFEKTTRHASGWVAVLGSIVLTVGLWLMVWFGGRS